MLAVRKRSSGIAGGRGGQSGRASLYEVKNGKRIVTVGDELDAVLAADVNSFQTMIALGGPGKLVKIYSRRKRNA